MRINLGVIAVLGCIAVIGATPVGERAHTEDIALRQSYVPN